MNYELISEEDYARLPANPEKKFVALEQICRTNMNRMINEDTTGDFDNLIRMQYMTIVAASAEELGIPGIQYVDTMENIVSNVAEFMRVASGVIARIRLRSSVGDDELSVRLASRTKGLIEHHLDKLRTAIQNGDLDQAKKTKLFSKIDAFRTELHRDRLSFAPAMSALVFISAGLVGTTSLLADAPDAIATITKLIGIDKELEEAETLRLGPPSNYNLIEAPPRKITKTSRFQDLDDDLPF